MVQKVISYLENKSGEASVLVANDDGALMVIGGRWKQCPRPEKPCPRPSADPMPEFYNKDNPKCRYCSYAATIYLKDQQQALNVGNIIAEIYARKGSIHHVD